MFCGTTGPFHSISTFSAGITNVIFILLDTALVVVTLSDSYGMLFPDSVSNFTGASPPIISPSTYNPFSISADSSYPKGDPLNVVPADTLSLLHLFVNLRVPLFSPAATELKITPRHRLSAE